MRGWHRNGRSRRGWDRDSWDGQPRGALAEASAARVASVAAASALAEGSVAAAVAEGVRGAWALRLRSSVSSGRAEAETAMLATSPFYVSIDSIHYIVGKSYCAKHIN